MLHLGDRGMLSRQVDQAGYRRQRVVDLVGNRAGQPRMRRQPTQLRMSADQGIYFGLEPPGASMQISSRWLLWLAAAILLAPHVVAQTALPAQVESAAPIAPAQAAHTDNQPAPDRPQPRIYRDLDLLRRHGFSEAQRASVSLRIFDRDGSTPPNLQSSDFAFGKY